MTFHHHIGSPIPPKSHTVLYPNLRVYIPLVWFFEYINSLSIFSILTWLDVSFEKQLSHITFYIPLKLSMPIVFMPTSKWWSFLYKWLDSNKKIPYPYRVLSKFSSSLYPSPLPIQGSSLILILCTFQLSELTNSHYILYNLLYIIINIPIYSWSRRWKNVVIQFMWT